MKYLWVLLTVLWWRGAQAQVITVPDVKISVTAASSAMAREQALDQAHTLAFRKMLNENFPEKAGGSLSHETIINMVENFSIDREKSTDTTYVASLTFQFDASLVNDWLQQQENAPARSELSSRNIESGHNLKLTASYNTLTQWQKIKKTLESFEGLQKLTVQVFSSQNAILNIMCSQGIERLQRHLFVNDFLLFPQDGEWVISSREGKPEQSL